MGQRLAIDCLDPFDNGERVREIWQSLEVAGESDFFRSWGWISAWLATIDRQRRIDFIALLQDGQPVGAFFLGRRGGVAQGIFYRQRAYLNATGDADFDEITIEYNGALEAAGVTALNCLFTAKEFARIEEFHMPALSQRAHDGLQVPPEFSVEHRIELPTYYVDLAAIQRAGGDYLDRLSSNKRSQLRRSLSLFEDSGPLRTVEAESTERALDMLAELRHLHELRWAERGRPGAFASEPFVRFHRELIASRFEAGEIQMLKIDNGAETIGYLYNFIHGGRVLYYQSGFNYGDSNRRRPGLVCHYQAIVHNLKKGLDQYNFLAGDSQYKKSLATHQESLFSVRIVRKGWKLRLEWGLRRLRDALRRTSV